MRDQPQETDLGNNTLGAFGTGPTSRYILNLKLSFGVAFASVHTAPIYAFMLIMIYVLF